MAGREPLDDLLDTSSLRHNETHEQYGSFLNTDRFLTMLKAQNTDRLLLVVNKYYADGDESRKLSLGLFAQIVFSTMEITPFNQVVPKLVTLAIRQDSEVIQAELSEVGPSFAYLLAHNTEDSPRLIRKMA